MLQGEVGGGLGRRVVPVAGRVRFAALLVEAVWSVVRRDVVGLLMTLVAAGGVAAVAAPLTSR